MKATTLSVIFVFVIYIIAAKADQFAVGIIHGEYNLESGVEQDLVFKTSFRHPADILVSPYDERDNIIYVPRMPGSKLLNCKKVAVAALSYPNSKDRGDDQPSRLYGEEMSNNICSITGYKVRTREEGVCKRHSIDISIKAATVLYNITTITFTPIHIVNCQNSIVGKYYEEGDEMLSIYVNTLKHSLWCSAEYKTIRLFGFLHPRVCTFTSSNVSWEIDTYDPLNIEYEHIEMMREPSDF
jgi:hypothetical protein